MRPLTALLMQTLQLTQYLNVVRVTLMHRLQRCQGAFGVATIGLQLSMVQGDGQFSPRLAVQRTLEQAIALLVEPLLVGRAGSAKVIEQRLALGFGGAMQMTLRAGPATLGQVQLAMLDGNLHPAAAIALRPRVDHTAGGEHQFDQGLDPPEHQP
ncbi:hypothetical protein D3C73_741400 [compost metagenome]